MTRLPSAFLDRPIAHRALHDVAQGRPENSRAAIQAAIAAGYGVEIDVQLTADGAAFVFHDYALDRLTPETGPVRQRKADALRSIPLSGGDETIPDLPEVLALVAGRVPILLEIKDQDGAMGPDIGPLEEAVAQATAQYDGPLAIMSFNPHSVARIGTLCPHLPRGLVTCGYDPADWPLSADICARLRQIPDYDSVGASFISHHADDLVRPRVAELKRNGADVLCWTIRSPEAAQTALKIAQNITFEGFLP
ncbi:phosphodiesterase [Aliishimia ponticola]|uniref:Phosphodiesterase n=1 Tax=Aliishimia ponticola TaxID=2499833 RepID=A0A4S4NCB2_9RHOB|nr:glycerophosphodiester phosphodiesterase family protein [Aliishimia ponticola]THH37009.1 phosphodiesterase [Aliishimia ponticola]